MAAADKKDLFVFQRPPRAGSFMRWLGCSITRTQHWASFLHQRNEMDNGRPIKFDRSRFVGQEWPPVQKCELGRMWVPAPNVGLDMQLLTA